MAFFKFRKGGQDHTASAAPAPSVEVLRKRAKHRLIGTAILVVVAVIGFPLLVDKPPRPVAFNIPIVIADKNSDSGKITPVLAPAPVEPAAPVAVVPAAAPVPVAASVVVVAPTVPASAAPALVVPSSSLTPALKPVAPVAPAAVSASDDRFVVQVGAFAEQTRAREVRLKLERAGLKTYSQVVESKEGRRTRIRTGPYASRAQAERDAEKIKKLDLPASILTL